MAASSYIRRVDEVMDFIRGHLDEDLSLEQLAEIAHFSPFHFHRIFAAVAGETPGAFTRRARLERATYVMKASPGKRLATVAVEAGYASHSDLTRAFKTAYGIAPRRWDRVSALTGRQPPIAPGGPGRFGRPDPPLRVEVRRHRPVRIAYVRVQGPFRFGALESGYERLTTELAAVGFDWQTAQMVGASWDNYDSTPEASVRFDLGFAVDPSFEPPEQLRILDLPDLISADVHCCGPLLRVGQAWDHLYLEWLPSSEFEPDHLPALKRFRRRPDETGWDLWDVDCTIPVRPLRR